MENVVDKCGGKLHIVMFPWLAFGHMIPYLELSKLIAKKGHKISFVSTPRNIDRLPKLPSDISPNINFVKLSLPKTKNLPEDAEATTDLPYDSVKYLKIAYDGLQETLTQFLEISSPDWIVHDFTPYWLKPIPVGQLPTTAYDDTQTGKEWEEAIKPWLDQQSKGSVIYTAFGSEAKPSQAEVTTIALGLEKSKLPFFWVLRKQRGYWDKELLDLPQGFEDRMKGRGVVCTSWAPQFKIRKMV